MLISINRVTEPLEKMPSENSEIPAPPLLDKEYWKKWVTEKSTRLPMESGTTINLVDLFSGCGGMTLGVSEAASIYQHKLSIALAADNLPAAASIYKSNFKNITKDFHSEDISQIFPADGLISGQQALRDKYGTIDLLVAGPPCQGHSNLNNSTRRDDPRNKLYLSAITAIETLRPTVAIVENVPAVIHDKTGVTQSSHARLSKAGYSVEELVLRIDRLGLPQQRKRHLLIARLNEGPSIAEILLFYEDKAATLREYIGDLEGEWKEKKSIYATTSSMSAVNQGRAKILFDRKIYDLPNADRPACHRDKLHSYKSAYGRLNWSTPAQTITSGFGSMGQGRYIHPSEPRTITPHEAARIQGFPDFFDFSLIEKRTQLQEVIANAVPPPAIAMLVQTLIEINAFKRDVDGKEKS